MKTMRNRIYPTPSEVNFINLWPYLSVVEGKCNNMCSKKSFER